MNDALHAALARRIMALAKRHGWSMNRLSAESGVSKAQVSRIVNLTSSPTLGVIARIATALGTVPSALTKT